MSSADRLPTADLPDTAQARQLREGFPWLTFDRDLEGEFRRAHFDENLLHTRVNLCLAVVITIAFAAMESTLLGHELNRVPNIIHRIYPPLAVAAAIILGLSVSAIEIIATLGGTSILFPCLMLTIIFIYFMGGLIFYHAVAANVIVMLGYFAAGTMLSLPGREFAYNSLAMVAANLFGASIVYMHEKSSRMRFLEAGLLRELVARDGLTGIQNRRMFDQHIQRVWQQAVREEERVAVLLADIDCFKDYNDRYGHQAGDECLRAVAVSLTQCARRPLDFVARYGGEEFAVVLYEASREYVAEVLTRIQRSIAELNIPHEASRVAGRLTLSIGAAFILPSSTRTPHGLIQLADEALYCAKEQGRNRVVVMEAEYHTLTTGRFEKRHGQRAG
jgi:diguanylate cyclase (GGDEF)-like protein